MEDHTQAYSVSHTISTLHGTSTSLEILSLDDNQLTGEIPPELGNLKNLKALQLDFNELTGRVPEELVNLVRLEFLGISFNQLSGEIPPEWGSLTNLFTLRLDDNRLTGEIPVELSNLLNLRDLYLNENELTGQILPELGSLWNLNRLRLDDNQLIGGIPPELGNLTNLEVLYLSGNPLTGCAPAEWREIEYVQIDLPHCDEPLEDSPSDPDPALVSSCSNGVVIRDLENNLGLVSNCVALLEAKEILIGSNRPGRLPEPSLNWGAEISIYEWDGVTIGGSPNQVQGLDLTEMGLTGEIPPELGRMAGLRELSLAPIHRVDGRDTA